jgi:prepilin signal peptidase PulO-like enzyme (type II secretory pathway)
MLAMSAMHWMWACWLLVIGACFGSFLNVVIYRLPQGMSLLYPPSRCPGCSKRIRSSDNVPVIGWLRLGGRCRDCGTRISARYPLIEASVGLFFFSLAAWRLFPAALEPEAVDEQITILGGVTLADGMGYLWQILLWCTLLAAACMAYDRVTVVARLFIPALLAAFVIPAVWPEVRSTSLLVSGDALTAMAMGFAQMMDSACGAILASCLAYESFIAMPDKPQRAPLGSFRGEVLASAVVGASGGPLIGLTLVGAACVGELITGRLGIERPRRRLIYLSVLLGGATLMLFDWQGLFAWQSSLTVSRRLLLWLLIAAIPWIAHRVEHPRSSTGAKKQRPA